VGIRCNWLSWGAMLPVGIIRGYFLVFIVYLSLKPVRCTYFKLSLLNNMRQFVRQNLLRRGDVSASSNCYVFAYTVSFGVD
jgi:hypothetical protein